MENIKKFAELFNILCSSFDGADLGKKVSQKIFYFFEREGMNLNLRYGIHYYGPYSSKLDNVMHVLESEDYISIDTSGMTHIISPGSTELDTEILTDKEKGIVNKVIIEFAHKSPLELEALATIDYVANTMLSGKGSDDEIISLFKEIKGDKFKADVIDSALQTLKNLNFIAA